MIVNISSRRKTVSYRVLSGFVAFAFVFNLVLPPGYAQLVPQTLLNLPAPGTMVPLSSGFMPVTITGITVHPENPLAFDFIIATGDESLDGEAFQEESRKLIKYFLATLTVPNRELWVNLSPYEKDRIVPTSFGNTQMGRDMLAQDYILKQLTASLMYPEDELGKKFWDRVYAKAQAKYGTSEIPMNTFNKIWIVPQDAVVYEHGQSAFVIRSRLKVMLEEDYVALQENLGVQKYGLDSIGSDEAQVLSGVTSEVVREVLIPEIEKEVNEGETFANLRQIYNSVILATWYEQNLKGGLLGQLYVDRNKTKGVDNEDKDVNQKIYERYVEAFKKGVYNYIREDVDPQSHEVIPRKYFSGGTNMDVEITTVKSPDVSGEYTKDINGIVSSPVKKVEVNLADIGPKANAAGIEGAVVQAERQPSPVDRQVMMDEDASSPPIFNEETFKGGVTAALDAFIGKEALRKLDALFNRLEEIKVDIKAGDKRTIEEAKKIEKGINRIIDDVNARATLDIVDRLEIADIKYVEDSMADTESLKEEQRKVLENGQLLFEILAGGAATRMEKSLKRAGINLEKEDYRIWTLNIKTILDKIRSDGGIEQRLMDRIKELEGKKTEYEYEEEERLGTIGDLQTTLKSVRAINKLSLEEGIESKTLGVRHLEALRHDIEGLAKDGFDTKRIFDNAKVLIHINNAIQEAVESNLRENDFFGFKPENIVIVNGGYGSTFSVKDGGLVKLAEQAHQRETWNHGYALAELSWIRVPDDVDNPALFDVYTLTKQGKQPLRIPVFEHLKNKGVEHVVFHRINDLVPLVPEMAVDLQMFTVYLNLVKMTEANAYFEMMGNPTGQKGGLALTTVEKGSFMQLVEGLSAKDSGGRIGRKIEDLMKSAKAKDLGGIPYNRLYGYYSLKAMMNAVKVGVPMSIKYKGEDEGKGKKRALSPEPPAGDILNAKELKVVAGVRRRDVLIEGGVVPNYRVAIKDPETGEKKEVDAYQSDKGAIIHDIKEIGNMVEAIMVASHQDNVSSPVTLGKQVENFVRILKKEGVLINQEDVGEALRNNFKSRVIQEDLKYFKSVDTFRKQLGNNHVATALASLAAPDLWKVIDRDGFIVSLVQEFISDGADRGMIEDAIESAGLGASEVRTVSSSPVVETRDDGRGANDVSSPVAGLQDYLRSRQAAGVLTSTQAELTVKGVNNWLTRPGYPQKLTAKLRQMIADEDWAGITQGFYKVLEFGTAGKRGIQVDEQGDILPGSNHINDYTVAEYTLGLARYLLKTRQQDRGVVLGGDTRIKSILPYRGEESYVELQAKILRKMGIKVYRFKEPRSIGHVAWTAVAHDAASMEYNSASHNMWTDNGVKASNEFGAQLFADERAGILEEIEGVEPEDIAAMNLDEFDLGGDLRRNPGMHVLLGSREDQQSDPSIMDADTGYIEANRRYVENVDVIRRYSSQVHSFYTPIQGSGIYTIPHILTGGDDFKFDVVISREQKSQDAQGRFGTVEKPDPNYVNEKTGARTLDTALREAEEMEKNLGVQFDFVFGTDPDADRSSYAVRDREGNWNVLKANDVWSLFAWYRLTQLSRQGRLKAGTWTIETWVTTDLIADIVQDPQFNLKVLRPAVGFNKIAEVALREIVLPVLVKRHATGDLKELQRTKVLTLETLAQVFGASSRKEMMGEINAVLKEFLLFGAEESNGYSPGGHTLEKDGAAAAVTFHEIVAFVKSVNRNKEEAGREDSFLRSYFEAFAGRDLTIAELLNRVYLQYGYYATENIPLVFDGLTGKAQKTKVLQDITDLAAKVNAGVEPVMMGDRRVQKAFSGKEQTSTDNVQFNEAGYKFMVGEKDYIATRPSGTEPYIRLYGQKHVPAVELSWENIETQKKKADDEITKTVLAVKKALAPVSSPAGTSWIRDNDEEGFAADVPKHIVSPDASSPVAQGEREQILREDWKYYSEKFNGYLSRLRGREEGAKSDLIDFLNDVGKTMDAEMADFPVEARYPLLKAAALLNKSDRQVVLNIIEESRNKFKSDVVDAIPMMFDLVPAGWLEKMAPQMRGRVIYTVSPENLLLAGGLGYVMQVHEKFMHELGARVVSIEPMYKYRKDMHGQLQAIDYASAFNITDKREIGQDSVDVGGYVTDVRYWKGRLLNGKEVMLIEEVPRPGGTLRYTNTVYDYNNFGNHSWEEFSAFFGKAVLKLIRTEEDLRKAEEMGAWRPAIVWGNDSQAAGAMALIVQEKNRRRDDSASVLRDIYPVFSTHTFGNRQNFGLDQIDRVLGQLLGLEKRYYSAAVRFNIIDMASLAIRLVDGAGGLVNMVSRKHKVVLDRDQFDPDAKTVAITNGDDLSRAWGLVKDIDKDIYNRELKDADDLTWQEARSVVEEAVRRLNVSFVDEGVNDLGLDPAKPIVSYAGRLVNVKVSPFRTFTERNIKRLVADGYNVVLFGRLQNYKESMDLADNYRRIEEWISAQKEGDPKATAPWGRFVFKGQYNDAQKQLMLIASNLIALDSDDETGTSEWTEVNGAIALSWILASPWRLRAPDSQKVILGEGILAEANEKGINLVVPEVPQDVLLEEISVMRAKRYNRQTKDIIAEVEDAYYETIKSKLNEAKSDPEAFYTGAIQSAKIAKVVNGYNTAAAYLTQWSKNVDTQSKWRMEARQVSKNFVAGLNAEHKQQLLNGERNGIRNFVFHVPPIASISVHERLFESGKGLRSFRIIKNAIEAEVWDGTLGHLRNGDYVKYIDGLTKGLQGQEAVLIWLNGLVADNELSWYKKDLIFSEFVGTLIDGLENRRGSESSSSPLVEGILKGHLDSREGQVVLLDGIAQTAGLEKEQLLSKIKAMNSDPQNPVLVEPAGLHTRLDEETLWVRVVRKPARRESAPLPPGRVYTPSDAPGGIDLNPALLDLQIKRDGNGVPLPLPQQPLEHMSIEGFIPVIINITPVTDLPMLLGIAEDERPDHAAQADIAPMPMELGRIEAYRNKYSLEYGVLEESGV